MLIETTEPNIYHVAVDGRHLATVQLSGEFLPCRQRMIMAEIEIAIRTNSTRPMSGREMARYMKPFETIDERR